MMGKSFLLGKIRGIRLQVHWTFFLVLAWVGFTALAAGQQPLAAGVRVAFVMVLFGCVLLHELGHALAAAGFGIRTKDITLLPIGGVARLERMPRRPLHELIVAVAGPMVNVVIAAVLCAGLALSSGWQAVSLSQADASFVSRLMWVNIALVAFNMLPAFPLDGGRVLRATLASMMNFRSATRVAATIGQLCAIGFAVLGLANPMLLLIAAFVFLSAAAEANSVNMQERLRGLTVRDGMTTSFQVVESSATAAELAPRLVINGQVEYPVVENGQLVGMLRRNDAIDALERQPALAVSAIMHPLTTAVEETDSLLGVMEAAAGRTATLPVVTAGKLTGLLEHGNILGLVEARARIRLAESSASHSQGIFAIEAPAAAR